MKKISMLVLCVLLGLSMAVSGPGEATAAQDAKDFQPVTVVDNEQCAVTINQIDPTDIWGYTLKAEMQNKSADKVYMFAVEWATVNGVLCDPMFAKEITAGMKAKADISLPVDSLENYGVGDVSDIEIAFHVYDSDDWMADPVAEQTIHIYPLGEENATAFVRQAQDTDVIMADNEMVAALVTGYRDDPIWGYTADLYLENRTDKTVMFSVDGVAVNGYMIDPFFAKEVPAGKCAFTSMSWSDSQFEENGITDVETIMFTLTAYDSDDWMADDIVDQSVTLTPQG